MDAHTLRCEIGGGITGKVVLQPPLAAPLRSVMVDGAACMSFDANSVTVPHTPAQVTCTT
jgi:hypothetical protein